MLKVHITSNASKIQRMEEKITKNYAKLTDVIDGNREMADYEIKKLGKTIENIEKLKHDIRSVSRQVINFEKDYTRNETHLQLKERLDRFSEIEYLNKLNNYYLPLVRDYTRKIDKNLEEIASVKQVVRSFDEDICLKASKADIEIMKKLNA